MPSLSARRAWIEMSASWMVSTAGAVALRKESVDRNVDLHPPGLQQAGSLSARRAWIEISSVRWCWTSREVALRKESVDRNKDVYEALHLPPRSLSARRAWIEIVCPCAGRKNASGRSPQGERG